MRIFDKESAGNFLHFAPFKDPFQRAAWYSLQSNRAYFKKEERDRALLWIQQAKSKIFERIERDPLPTLSKLVLRRRFNAFFAVLPNYDSGAYLYESGSSWFETPEEEGYCLVKGGMSLGTLIKRLPGAAPKGYSRAIYLDIHGTMKSVDTFNNCVNPGYIQDDVVLKTHLK